MMDFAEPVKATVPARVILITSSKGGVGKTTVCANLAMAFAMAGQRVLAVDLDIDNRCLDLIMGMENEAMYHFLDVLDEVVDVSVAAICHPRCPKLQLLSAPSFGQDAPDKARFSALFHRLKHSGAYDVILLDTPGAVGTVLDCAADVCDEALIISSALVTAVRGAGMTGNYLCGKGVENQHLVVNQFFTGKKSRKQATDRLTLIRMIDETGIPLIGMIPFDRRIWQAQNEGILIDDIRVRQTDFAVSIQNLFDRLNGGHVPLCSGMTMKETHSK